MLEEIYKDYLMDKSEYTEGAHVCLKIQGGNLPKTSKVSKKMSDEEQEKVRQENEKIRAQRKEIVDPIAELIARFKINWITAPIRRAMNSAKAKKALNPVEIKYRAVEKYWVTSPEANTTMVTFAVHFDNQ